jgi:hypothetical protein
MRKVKLMNKVTDKSKDSTSMPNFNTSGKGFSTKKEELNMTPSSNPSARKMIEKENIKQAIKNAAKKGKLD